MAKNITNEQLASVLAKKSAALTARGPQHTGHLGHRRTHKPTTGPGKAQAEGPRAEARPAGTSWRAPAGRVDVRAEAHAA